MQFIHVRRAAAGGRHRAVYVEDDQRRHCDRLEEPGSLKDGLLIILALEKLFSQSQLEAMEQAA